MKRLSILILTLLATTHVVFAQAQLPELIPYRKGSNWGFVDQSGKTVIPFHYDRLYKFNIHDLANAQKGGKWGVIDKAEKVVLDFEYDEIIMHKDLPLIKVKKDGKWNMFSTSGKRLIARWYDEVGWLSEGMIPVREDRGPEDARIEKWGFVDKSGLVKITIKYDRVSAFNQGLAMVQLGKVFGYINHAGKEAIEIRYAGAMAFHDSLAPFALLDGDRTVRDVPARKWGFLDKSGRQVIRPEFNRVWYFYEGLAPVESSGLWGYINKKGDFVSKGYEFMDARDFTDSIAMVQAPTALWGFVNYDIDWIAKPLYTYARPFSDSLAAVKKNGDWGYIDKAGNTKIAFKYYSAMDFTEGFAPVRDKRTKLWGYINKNGEQVIAPKFQQALNFQNGLALVNYRGQWGYVDSTGKEYFED